ncbi:predicted protein [Histoplasma capsulatum G186AR]|uniref:Uncharacterized protein n=1 Tax=Ajellomyces capsulatus (strain G186AR / H82 / ATCC MYA-2454 / RMSCC 2432) TaxID=447093 RepID=C0NYJ0_AJECG|nr:uncharacterized protein HCBG_07672 [Histoplasma capsulatum G186AR]EEH03546.1 predicted protein [Histoplasma capsulatum G186AR]
MAPNMMISIADLDKLTAKDFEGVREIVNSRQNEYSLDATELEEKLKTLSNADAPRRSASSTSVATTPTLSHTPSRLPTPTPEAEAFKKQHLADCIRDYNYLVEHGGRPAFPLEYATAAPKNFGKYRDMIDYWGQSYYNQRNVWVSFQNFQLKKRRSMEIFTQYQQDIHDYREKEGIEGDIQLHFDEERQSRVDQWKEYHYYLHRRVPPWREKAEAARKEREQDMLDWESGKRNPKIPEDMGWIHTVRTLVESDLEEYMSWIQWVEAELPKIEQECAESAGKNVDDESCLAEKEDVATEPTAPPPAHAESAPPPTETHPRSRRQSISRIENSKDSVDVIDTPEVLHKQPKLSVSAEQLTHADSETASLTKPDQSSTSAGQATGEASTTGMQAKRSSRLAKPDKSSASTEQATGEASTSGLPQKRSSHAAKLDQSGASTGQLTGEASTSGLQRKRSCRVAKPSTTATAESVPLRRSQRIIDMELRKAQQAEQEAAEAKQIALKAGSRREPAAQQMKGTSKPAPARSQSQTTTKPREPRRRRLSSPVKINTLAREVMV